MFIGQTEGAVIAVAQGGLFPVKGGQPGDPAGQRRFLRLVEARPQRRVVSAALYPLRSPFAAIIQAGNAPGMENNRAYKSSRCCGFCIILAIRVTS